MILKKYAKNYRWEMLHFRDIWCFWSRNRWILVDLAQIRKYPRFGEPQGSRRQYGGTEVCQTDRLSISTPKKIGRTILNPILARKSWFFSDFQGFSIPGNSGIFRNLPENLKFLGLAPRARIQLVSFNRNLSGASGRCYTPPNISQCTQAEQNWTGVTPPPGSEKLLH